MALNRAVAVGMADGPDCRACRGRCNRRPLNYHLYPSVRGDLLMKLGRNAEAREELQRAISLTDNAREKQLLTEKSNRI